ncbi:hypothetical protein [Pseudoalteromonas denitrificans]|uniref:Uncharacterized protein n=1 Tax=Pseudoalteromonas denitrificans DSM 6059 TaxID=1123010 RepID=A0A1I1IUR5_9GAMM|nr:hypothetical protein [Pseudoalteromonas denitrificans]SFC38048.1 hypothetical protein SAMN02745724_01557 [Pseudoalteromonas denitrificans DSM 6059]
MNTKLALFTASLIGFSPFIHSTEETKQIKKNSKKTNEDIIVIQCRPHPNCVAKEQQNKKKLIELTTIQMIKNFIILQQRIH